MYQYYITRNPPLPGLIPENGLMDIEDRDPNEIIPEIEKGAYALLTYDRPLTEEEINDCGMTDEVNSIDFFNAMYKGSFYTVIGVSNTDEYRNGYESLMISEGIGKPKYWAVFKGQDMNRHYHLTGSNRYKDSLTFMAFPLKELDVSKLAVFRLKMGDHWFDDIVDNNSRREQEALG